jgi:hypothetical protein
MLSLRRKDELLIPTGMLKALAAAGLPPDVGAYNTRLHELMREAH